MIGGIAETQEMLEFCAEHDVRPEIEVHSARLHQRGIRARARPATCGNRFVNRYPRRYGARTVESSTPASGHPAAAQLGGDALDVLRDRRRDVRRP